MKNTVFIHTNNKQLLGALIAKHSIESRLENPEEISVEIINVDELDAFKNFEGVEYVHGPGDVRRYNRNDLQSFTLSRFMPPELMGYQGRAVVIDPDIFALTDITSLFRLDLKNTALAACTKRGAWDSSVMVLDCSRLTHWSIQKILNNLRNKTSTYKEIMTLQSETEPILELSRDWNDIDHCVETTKLLHLSNRVTQPWKTGLPIDFTRNKLPKFWGLIPREPLYALIGKNSTYEEHPDAKIKDTFRHLLMEAINAGVVTRDFIENEVTQGHVRKDIFALIN